MNRRADTPASRRDFHEAAGVLLVTREPPPPPPPVKGQPAAVPGNPAEGVEILIAVWDDGSVTALNGHVDLGTGIRTALAQIVAEELDVPMDRVNMVLGDTARAPNQGATIASASIQIHAVPLRIAAAQARAWLIARAAEHLGANAAELTVEAGIVAVTGHAERAIGYADLVRERHVELLLDTGTPVKRPEEYKVVGQSMPRVDIPGKATGELTFVHDLRVPGMLHGRVIRPPYAGADHGDFIGRTLESVDEQSIAHIPGVVAVVAIGDFVGVVAKREEHAEQAMRDLVVTWKDWPALPNLANLEVALRDNPSTRRVVAEQGDVDAALANAAIRMDRTYVWPYQLHASIGPSCAVADWHPDRMTVWAGTQNPHVLRADLAKLMDLADVAIDVIRMEAAGCYGRNCADDVAADAALLSRAVGHPVRVQLTREQEHQWEPKGAAQLMEVRGGLNADGSVAAYDFQTSYPSNGALTLALLLTGKVSPGAVAYEMGDRTSVPPYDYANLRVAINDMAPILRASWLRGVSALPNSFAHESYIDELASEAGVDPVEFRLRYLKDDRAAELVRATVERAGWLPHTRPQQQAPDGDFLKGQGFAYARYTHSRFPGFGAAWSAWVADVEVNRNTGEVHVRRVVVGQDAGLMINPAGVKQQIHGNVVQTTSRALKEEVQVDSRKNTVASKEWGSYPILNFREVPVIDVMMMQRPDQPPQGAGESSSVPGTAAIANAIFDATGVRFRKPPFTAEVVKAALNPPPAEPAKPPRTRRPWWAVAGALVA
uniref:xanthine dehydrogenase family protein molybdopterin-binding subunit n=1 Tax=Noviherbaspirillum sp. TaxID=1926288 RepID=UPI002FE3CBE1